MIFFSALISIIFPLFCYRVNYLFVFTCYICVRMNVLHLQFIFARKVMFCLKSCSRNQWSLLKMMLNSH